jgi:hypothetical protein
VTLTWHPEETSKLIVGKPAKTIPHESKPIVPERAKTTLHEFEPIVPKRAKTTLYECEPIVRKRAKTIFHEREPIVRKRAKTIFHAYEPKQSALDICRSILTNDEDKALKRPRGAQEDDSEAERSALLGLRE